MISLPRISALKKRCRALAALDLILSPEWEYRHFSYNSEWGNGQEMASMRNGCGDEWFCLFHPTGWAALKGLAHESEAWTNGNDRLCEALRSSLPAEFADFTCEPAFRWDATGFVFTCEREGKRWYRVADATDFAAMDAAEDEHLSLLNGTPQDYVNYAADYFGREVDIATVASVFELAPLSRTIAEKLNPTLDWSFALDELFLDIAYPKLQ